MKARSRKGRAFRFFMRVNRLGRTVSMRLLVVVLASVAAACAHDKPADTGSAALVPAQLISCAVEPPTASFAGDVSADFQVDTRGRVRDVHVQGAQGAYANALRRHLASCEYSPATRGGRPVATRRAVLYGAYR